MAAHWTSLFLDVGTWLCQVVTCRRSTAVEAQKNGKEHAKHIMPSGNIPLLFSGKPVFQQNNPPTISELIINRDRNNSELCLLGTIIQY